MKPRSPAILFYAPNWLGDAVMATPALRSARMSWPDHHIILAGTASACGILRGLPYFDQTLEIPSKAGLPWMLRAARTIRKQYRIQLAFILPHSFRAALFASLTGARRRVGINRGGRRLLLTDPVPPRLESGQIAPEYMAFKYLRLVEQAGGRPDDQGLSLAVSENARNLVAEKLTGEDRPVIALAPGAAFGASKRWAPERFAAVADYAYSKWNATCVLLTGPGDSEVRDAVLKSASVPITEIREGGLETLKAVIERADILIGNDSGPRHIAVALGTPVICIMGSTSPAYTDSPWEKGDIIRANVPCAPCQQPECPLEHHRCMKDISVEMVTEALKKWLNTRRETGKLPNQISPA